MLNQVICVGRLIDTPKIETTENGSKKSIITIAVNRCFKNPDGVYETDLIDCVLYKGIATNTAEYCRKGDVIGIRGRIQTKNVDDKRELEIIADKITFLSSNQKEVNE